MVDVRRIVAQRALVDPKSPARINEINLDDINPNKNPDELWREAIDDYVKKYGIKIKQLESAGHFDDAESGADKAKQLFENSRHPLNKRGKAAKVVGESLDWIKSTVNFVSGCAPDGVSDSYLERGKYLLKLNVVCYASENRY